MANANYHKAIVAKLGGTTAVTDEIGTRLYPMFAPRSATMPFAVYEFDGTEHTYSMTGDEGLYEASFGITVVAATFQAAISAGDAIRNALTALSGTIGDVDAQISVQRLHVDTVIDRADAAVDGSDQPLFIQATDFSMHYRTV